MAEAVVATYEDELEAETAAGYLRSLGIAARVHFEASLGLPRSTVPIRVVSPPGAFEILVVVLLAPILINWIASLSIR